MNTWLFIAKSNEFKLNASFFKKIKNSGNW